MPAAGFVDELHKSVAERTDGISGRLMPEETEELYALAHAHGNVILKVGTFRGRSATVMNLAERKRRKRQFFSSDMDPSSRIHALDVLRWFGVDGRAYFFQGGLDAFRAKIKISPTLAFIDGDHSYKGVRRDVDLLSSLLRPGVPVVFHDCLDPSTPGVLRAVNEWVELGFASLTDMRHLRGHVYDHEMHRSGCFAGRGGVSRPCGLPEGRLYGNACRAHQGPELPAACRGWCPLSGPSRVAGSNDNSPMTEG